MAQIFPFRAYRYAAEAGALKDLVTQPYDKINDELREDYFTRSPWNIAHVIKSNEGPADGKNEYKEAAALFGRMIDEGALRRDDEPAIYIYDIEYRGPEGDKRVRSGFIALAQLEDFSKGGVKPHENTLEGPKADRLNLMRATGANFGQIFMLYPDQAKTSDKLIKDYKSGRKPDMEVVDDFGETHRVWIVTDADFITQLQGVLETVDLFIADGHHRYETAVNFWRESEAKGKKGVPPHSVDRRMMTFVNMYAEGMTVFATHRLVHSLPPEMIDPARLIGELEKDFEIRVIGELQGGEDDMLEYLEQEYQEGHVAFGLVITEIEEECYVLRLTNEDALNDFFGDEYSDSYKHLDCAVLHGLILEKVLGIDKEALAKQTNVSYIRDAKEGIRQVHEGRIQLAFLMNPTRPEEVAEVAGGGERMPQKSTDFYPKMITGLTINKIDFE